MTDAASLDAAFSEVEAQLGPIEVVVANAGITRDTLLMRMSDEDFTSVVDTNLSGAFRVVKRASKGMLKARFGRVILDLERRRSARLGRPGQLLRVEERLDRPRPVAHARARWSRHHGERRGSRFHRDRHDGRARPSNKQAEYKQRFPRAGSRRRARWPRSSPGWRATKPGTSRARSSPSTAASGWATRGLAGPAAAALARGRAHR